MFRIKFDTLIYMGVFSAKPCAGQHKPAFTLAEALITLGIIGVVAAMTLPALIQGYEKQKNLAVLQRGYSDLGQYLKSFDLEYGCDGSLANCAPNKNEFVYKFTQYLIEKQKFKQVNPKFIYVNNFNGTPSTHATANNSWTGKDEKIGAVVMSPTGLYMYYINVNEYDLYYKVGKNLFRSWIWIFTDNSKFFHECKNCSREKQAQARMGRNLFQAFIMNDERLIPNGSSYCTTRDSWGYHCQNWVSDKTCNADYKFSQGTHDRNMWGCLGRIIDEGWKINYY